MSAVDIAFAVVVGLSVFWGLWRGITRELIATISWVIIGVLVYRYAGPLGSLVPLSAPPVVRIALAGAAILVIGIFAAALAGRGLRSVVAASDLAGTDRMLGAVFGALRGALLSLLVTGLVVETGFAGARPWRASASGPALERVWQWISHDVAMHRGGMAMVNSKRN